MARYATRKNGDWQGDRTMLYGVPWTACHRQNEFPCEVAHDARTYIGVRCVRTYADVCSAHWLLTKPMSASRVNLSCSLLDTTREIISPHWNRFFMQYVDLKQLATIVLVLVASGWYVDAKHCDGSSPLNQETSISKNAKTVTMYYVRTCAG